MVYSFSKKQKVITEVIKSNQNTELKEINISF